MFNGSILSKLFPDPDLLVVYLKKRLDTLTPKPPFHIYVMIHDEGIIHNETENITDFIRALIDYYTQRGKAMIHEKMLAGTHYTSALFLLYQGNPTHARILFYVNKESYDLDQFLEEGRALTTFFAKE